jgi:CheY-like chemotaxis protein
MPREHNRKYRVLVVEDSIELSKLLKLSIERQDNLEVTTVVNGDHAVGECKEKDFDVALMDIKMPVMDGIEATRQIRNNEKLNGRKRTHIIAFTVLSSEELRQECVEAGVDCLIEKPARVAEVVDSINKLLP